MLSRVADCMYWMSRYLERAEHTARLIDVQLTIALDETPQYASLGWVCLLNALLADLPMEAMSDARVITHALALDHDNPSSILRCVENARENARQIREQITSEMWEEINALYLSLRDMDIDRVWQTGPHAFLRNVKRGAQVFAGVADSTMDRGQGWQFIRLGRFVERANALAWMLDAHFGIKGHATGEPNPEDFVAWAGLLRGCNAYEPYCKIHTVELRPRWILDFLLLSAEFPHSVRFSAREIEAAVSGICEWTGTPRAAEIRRLAGRLSAELEFQTIGEVLGEDLSAYLRGIVERLSAVHNAAYGQFIGYTVDSVLRGELVER